jgi:hypothetical protein
MLALPKLLFKALLIVAELGAAKGDAFIVLITGIRLPFAIIGIFKDCLSSFNSFFIYLFDNKELLEILISLSYT